MSQKPKLITGTAEKEEMSQNRNRSRNFKSLCRSMRVFSNPHRDADSRAIKPPSGPGDRKTIIYPRGLNITWGNDKRYWQLPRRDQKDEDAFAELIQVCWLEVTGSINNNIEKGKKYKVGFKITMKPDAFGWEGCDVYIMAKIGKKGLFSSKKLCFEMTKDSGKTFDIPEDDFVITATPPPDSPSDLKLYFGMYEVWSGKWKGGLQIHYAFVEKVDN